MDETAIRDKLVERGGTLFHAPKRELVRLAKVDAADRLLNDFVTTPHAFVLACIMGRQITAERAWLIPHMISERLGDFSIERLAQLSRAEIKGLMSDPKPLHRFVDTMSGLFHAGVQRITNSYAGNAARIWEGKPSSAAVVYRFLEFDGAGPKIATMAANILARDFKIEFADYVSIDISADRQVRRVFGRLGLCPDQANIEQLIYKARALHPVFPGIMDLPCWEIGRNWCQARNPNCSACYMNELCPTAS